MKDIKAFLKKKKEKKQQCGCVQLKKKKLPEDQEQKLVEYRTKNIKKMRKSVLL